MTSSTRMTSSTPVSVVVPVYNGSPHLRECLLALEPGPASELIVVDDASTDDSAAVALAVGARVVRFNRRRGPAAARNAGAGEAQGEILFFVDADVVVAPEAIGRLLRTFAARPDVSAVFGSYDAAPRAPGVVSRFRNLLHHFVHQHANPDAFTFWAGCGAVRRSAFWAVGGFDEARYARPSIEDIELGHRLRHAGHRILLDKGLQGTHLKRWTLCSLVRTDVLYRGLPWSRLLIQTGIVPDDLNLRWDQRASVVLISIAALALPLSLLQPGWLVLAIGAFLGVIVLNRALYAFFRERHGFLFAVAGIGLHALHYLCGAAAGAFAVAESQIRPLVARVARSLRRPGAVRP